ncbi:MAG TPA: DUF2905 family protein [Longilinea sp.]|nr:DUF2905 family protein [Longilinea sp.]
MENFGKLLVVIGVVVIVAGGVIWLLGRLLGNQNLPGTLRLDFPGGSCVIPILASIVISLVLTVVLNLLARWLNR